MEMERYLLLSCSPVLPLLEVSFPSRKLRLPSGSLIWMETGFWGSRTSYA
ncbi:hypothetical protein NC651_006204 [Populus alba x Populus x berolinensis]|nr:hypothetical protein NC651_006204 [Populus alba x Populus x berolinensis]